jgi:fatty-acid desaturase
MSSDGKLGYTSTTSVGRRIWWSNAVFSVSFHLIGLAGFWNWPSSWRVWLLLYINWQIAMLGITMGIHESIAV